MFQCALQLIAGFSRDNKDTKKSTKNRYTVHWLNKIARDATILMVLLTKYCKFALNIINYGKAIDYHRTMPNISDQPTNGTEISETRHLEAQDCPGKDNPIFNR